MRTDIEDITPEYRVSFDLVEHDLRTQMLASKIQRILTNRIHLNLIPLHLFPVIVNNLPNLFMYPLHMMLALMQPFLL